MLYERKKCREIRPYLKTRDIIVIHGARQTGKTTVLKLLLKDLPPEDTAYFDLEDSNFLDTCKQGPETIVAYLRQRGWLKNQERFYLLIDEVQYLSNPSSCGRKLPQSPWWKNWRNFTKSMSYMAAIRKSY